MRWSGRSEELTSLGSGPGVAVIPAEWVRAGQEAVLVRFQRLEC